MTVSDCGYGARFLYIECAATALSPVNTGIQRVVRNLVNESKDVGGQFGFNSIPVAFLSNYFCTAAWGGGGLKIISRAQNNISVVDRVAHFVSSFLTGHSVFGLNLRIKQIIKIIAVRWLGWKARKGVTTATLNAVSPNGQPSVLLLLDSTWNSDMWPHVAKFRSQGGQVVAVLYDLIPFSHPETVDEQTHFAHTSWWRNVQYHVDAVLCISKSVRQDYLNWQKEQSSERQLPPERVGYFYLGAELSKMDPVIRLQNDIDPYFLVVGSIEPRKNHATILDAFEILWQRGVSVRLAIVGGFGWKSEALIERIINNPQYNHQLFFIRDATDRDLNSLYTGARAVVFASLAEGFGLPIVEAFQRCVPVICSDIPVFHEIASDRADYFDPHDPSSLAQAVSRKLSTGKPIDKAAQEEKWINWRDSCIQLLDRINQVLPRSMAEDRLK